MYNDRHYKKEYSVFVDKNEEVTLIHAKITPENEQAIKRFLEGVVYCWCRDNKPGVKFDLHKLMGKSNDYWQGNPMKALFDYYEGEQKGGEKNKIKTGHDAGRLLKAVLDEYPAQFGLSEYKEWQKREYWLA